MIYVDSYARQQQSPLKDKTFDSQQPLITNGGAGGTLNSEMDRLKREREDLLRSGCYTPDDPLIMELDRQIRATHLRI